MDIFPKTIIVIDMQNDFVSGPLGSEAAQKVIWPIESVLADAQLNGDNIIFTQDTHDKDTYKETVEGKTIPEHCIKDTEGWEVVSPWLSDYMTDADVVYKGTFGVINWKDQLTFDSGKLINPTSEIILVGVCTDICVISNALALRSAFPETKITIYKNCTAGTTEENKEAALKVAEANLINVENYETSKTRK